MATRLINVDGYYSGDAVREIETSNGPTLYIPLKKGSHHKTVHDIEKHIEPLDIEESADFADKIKHRLKTKRGKEHYKLRKQTVEPVFGTIKETLGFRYFHLRGLKKVSLGWDIVTLAYNFKRLFNMTVGMLLSEKVTVLSLNHIPKTVRL